MSSLPAAANRTTTRTEREEHPRRKEMLDLLDREGTASVRRFMVVGKMSRSSCLHHIRHLRRVGLITVRLVGRRLIFTRAGRTGFSPQTGPLPSELAQRVLEEAAANPNAKQKEIAEKAGVTQSYVSRVLSGRRGKPSEASHQTEEDRSAESRFSSSSEPLSPKNASS